jgi:hypothetical protein
MATVQLAPLHTKLLKTWTVLAQDAIAKVQTGATSEATLATIALAAGAMGPNGILRITHLWSNNNNANLKTQRIKIGGIEFHNFGASTTQSEQAVTIIRNRNSESSQVSQPTGNFFGFGNSTSAIVTAAINTAAAQSITFTAQLAIGTDTMSLESLLVELLYGA